MIRGMLVAALAFSQSVPGLGGTTGSLPVSPSVMATIMSSVDADGNGTLDLLVLWRGQSRAGLKETAAARAAVAAPLEVVRTRVPVPPRCEPPGFRRGASVSACASSRLSRKVWIQNQEMDLNESNVVLVDQVDQRGGPLVSGSVCESIRRFKHVWSFRHRASRG